MPITHTNRKGVTYTLCQGVTKTGKPRYYFTPNPGDNALDAIPDGWEIRESVNGVVSLAQQRTPQITDAEMDCVQAALSRHPQGERYRATAKGKQVILYERQGPDTTDILDILGSDLLPNAYTVRRLEESMVKRARYEPVMRFTLINAKHRRFTAERMTYTGHGGWRNLYHIDSIDALARRLIPALNTDDFYTL